MHWLSAKQRIEGLVEAHYASLYAFAYRLAGSAAAAEDLTQETFLLAQAKLGQLRDDAKARAWLFAILRNAYLLRLRHDKHEPGISLDEVGDVPDRLPSPLPAIDPVELQKVLNELPEMFRAPVILFYFQDFSYRDIADQLNLPLGTVMSRLNRAKNYLRQRLPQPTLAGTAKEGV